MTIVPSSRHSGTRENRFSVTPVGTPAEGWIGRFEESRFTLSKSVESVIRSTRFTVTEGVTTEVVILKATLFSERDRMTRKVYAEGLRRGLTTLSIEAACLIRVTLSDRDLAKMGFWWLAAMHEPIEDYAHDLTLLTLDRDVGGRLLRDGSGDPNARWPRDGGFAFARQATPESSKPISNR